MVVYQLLKEISAKNWPSSKHACAIESRIKMSSELTVLKFTFQTAVKKMATFSG